MMIIDDDDDDGAMLVNIVHIQRLKIRSHGTKTFQHLQNNSALRALGAMLRKFIGDHRHEKIEFQSAVFSSAISVQVPHTNYSVFWDRRTNVFILLLRKRFNTSLRSNENRKTISWRTFSKNIQHSIETRKILTKP